MKEGCAARLQPDVNVRLVKQLRDNIKSVIDFNKTARGLNIRQMIQSAVSQELIKVHICLLQNCFLFFFTHLLS